MSLNISPQPPGVSAFGTGVATSTGTIVLAAGANITLNTGASSITIVGPAPSGGGLTLSLTENVPRFLIHADPILTKAGTITGTAGFGSSLFLNRLLIPGTMNLSEVQAAMQLQFNATNDGAGTMSRSLAIYSFGNSTSLASLVSVSGTSSWNTGTTTAGASSSLTQFQAGWSASIIQPMSFASSSLAAGEYVIGQLLDFAQASSTWTLNLLGARGFSTGTIATALATSTASVLTGAIALGNGVTGVSAYGSQFLALSTAGSLTGFTMSGTVSTAASSQVLSVSTLLVSVTNAAKSCSFQLIGQSSNNNMISSIGLQAGSVITAGGTVGGITSVSLNAALSTVIGKPSVANLIFYGVGSVTTGFPNQFLCGTMSTGAIPASIALTSTAVKATNIAPWFALLGA